MPIGTDGENVSFAGSGHDKNLSSIEMPIERVMKVDIDQFGDVRRIRMTSLAGRVARVGVAVFVVDGVMIDSGFHGARRTIMSAVRELDVRGVIVTHWHEDHAGNVESLARAGVPIALRADTEDTLRHQPAIELYRRAIWRRPPALTARITPFENHAFECLHVPGHSRDHQVVWVPSTRTLFSGDLWLGTRVRILHADENPYEIAVSLRRAAALGPERMFDAHRGLVERPVEALERRAAWIDETTAEVERLIADGRSDSEILKRVLGGEETAGYISARNYSRLNFVRAVRRTMSSRA
ncbi:MAG TPA: MBL fold metallo-hydrolase [Gemmatimonadaceae bacterium]